MDDFTLLAVKAASLREKMAGGPLGPLPGKPAVASANPFGFTGEWPSLGPLRGGETGLGMPPLIPKNMADLTPAELANLNSPESKALSRYAGKSDWRPPGRPNPGRLIKFLQSRGGRNTMWGAGATLAGGIGMGLLGGRSAHPEPRSPLEIPTASKIELPSLTPESPTAPPEQASYQQQARATMLNKAKKLVGNWWSRMNQRYGSTNEG